MELSVAVVQQDFMVHLTDVSGDGNPVSSKLEQNRAKCWVKRGSH